MTEQVFVQDEVSTKTMVKSAINIVSAYHEVQFKKYMDVLEGCNPPELEKLVNKYHHFQEINESAEETFIAFLQYLGQ